MYIATGSQGQVPWGASGTMKLKTNFGSMVVDMLIKVESLKILLLPLPLSI